MPNDKFLGYGIDMQRVLELRHKPNRVRRLSSKFSPNVVDLDSVSDLYISYGVDNDFDLIEAIYDRNKRFTGNLLREPWFRELRIKCAMNPEYTERCLTSSAFFDIRDEILKRVSDD